MAKAHQQQPATNTTTTHWHHNHKKTSSRFARKVADFTVTFTRSGEGGGHANQSSDRLAPRKRKMQCSFLNSIVGPEQSLGSVSWFVQQFAAV
jgi:hypothetical protein